MSDSLLSFSHIFSPSLQINRHHHHHHRFLYFNLSSTSTSIKISTLISLPSKATASVAAFSSTNDNEEEEEEFSPSSIDLVPITSEEQFDRIIAEAQQLEESIVVLWMANWCRKCIYLKPKLEKLAADYHPRIRFFCIDVNTIPQKLVNRAGITARYVTHVCGHKKLARLSWGGDGYNRISYKMPTIQLWRDSQKQAEVIGGHKAWLVVDDVRQMIENED